MSVNARAIESDPGIPRRELFHSGDLIGERVVTHVAEVSFVKFLRPPRCAHAVDFHYYESQLCNCLRIAASTREIAAAHAAGLGPRINMVDDRIFFPRVEIGWFVHQPVKIGLAVARLDGERHRRLPSGGEQLRYVRLLEGGDQLDRKSTRLNS